MNNTGLLALTPRLGNSAPRSGEGGQDIWDMAIILGGKIARLDKDKVFDGCPFAAEQSAKVPTHGIFGSPRREIRRGMELPMEGCQDAQDSGILLR